MRSLIKIILSVLVVAHAAIMSMNTFAQAPKNYISVGYIGAGLENNEVEVVTAGYERLLDDSLSIQIRLIDLEYEYRDGSILAPYFEFEDGEGTIIELALHKYLGESGNGLYFGAGVGAGTIDYDYIENDFGFVTIESDDSFGYELFIQAGYNFVKGPLFIRPQIQVGNWFNIGETVDLYAAAGLELGLAF